MQLFLDIDGVILDFEKGFMEFLRQVYHPELPPGYRPQTWTMANEFKDVDIEVAWYDFVSRPVFTQLELIPEKALYDRLAARYEVHLVTNLPPRLYEPRLKNLLALGLSFHSLSLGGHHDFNLPAYPTKSAVIGSKRDKTKAMAFVDDHPINCQDVATAFPDALVILMNRPHNLSNNLPYPRVDGWNEIETLLSKHGTDH